ncbi:MULTISPECIES: lysozyme inhibitor LprI family protein [unclassified Ruegeria]|uniref:lysozyme inhibitor LprI family protein n=1 Tax=unclassified Ruegeria TaxID=2625375 RepID=UPI0014883F36|nr:MULTISPECIES: lysozyme inhibitor LprI family protein [unclassified Ruegeria]
MRFFLAALLVPFAASADPTLECSDASSQVEIGACVRDMELAVNDAVEAALGIAQSSAQELDEVTGREVALAALVASQAAWNAYRDAQCEAVGASFGGGSGTGIGITACRVELGRTRVDELLQFAN